MTMRQIALTTALALGMIGGMGGRSEGGYLLGTTVTSPGILFSGSGPFAFNTNTAVVSDPAVEFTYIDGANTDTFNFSDFTLTVTDVSSIGASSFAASFTDTAFLGASLSAASSGFPGLTASISGSTLTVQSATSISSSQTRSATFTFTTGASVPEPSSLALCGIAGVVGLAVARTRRQRCS